MIPWILSFVRTLSLLAAFSFCTWDMEKRKKSAGIGLAFMAVGAIGFVLCFGALTT